MDNGITYNDAEGTENWKYVVDTRAIPGGTQVVFLKITDSDDYSKSFRFRVLSSPTFSFSFNESRKRTKTFSKLDYFHQTVVL